MSTLTRLIILLATLALTWGAAALIPTEPELRPAAVIMSLPSKINGASGHLLEPSEQEIQLLAQDTTFEKKLYTSLDPDSTPGKLAGINCGIVLSGHDLNNSIHRPERCLVSQGFQDLTVTPVTIQLDNGSTLQVNRIDSYRTYNQESEGGQSYRIAHINYFWFVGSHRITSSHYGRSIADMKDRIIGGFNQRWAYFSISSNILENLPGLPNRPREETNQQIQDHIRQITKACIKGAAF
jgi:hypothetical protein